MITPSLPIPGVSGCDVPAAPVDQFQIETTCVAENSNLYIIETNQAVTPPTVKIFDFAGTDVTGTVTPVVCPGSKIDVEYVCFQDIADPTIKFTRGDIWDATTNPPVLSGAIWLDANGAVIAAPANVEQCGKEAVITQSVDTQDCANVVTTEVVDENRIVFTKAVANILQTVKDCNSDAFLLALQAIQANTALSNVNEASIITELQAIKTSVANIDANTDTLETLISTLIADQLLGNITLTNILTSLGNILTEVQAINANTDTVEALITATNTKLDALILEEDKELIVSAPVDICVDNLGVKTSYVVRQRVIFDSETNVIVSSDTEYSSDGIVWTLVAPLGTVTVGACANIPLGNTVQSANYIQLDAIGNYTGGIVTETKTYDSSGVLIATVYTDSVTGAVVALQPATTQLAPIVGMDFEQELMCDDGTTTFIRTYGRMPSGQIGVTIDTNADGTPYTPLGNVTIGACAVNTLPIVQCETTGTTLTPISPVSNNYNGVIAPLAGPTGDLTILGNSADGIIIDGVDWTFNVPIVREANFTIADQESALSITDNLANTCPFSSPIVWDEPTDPAGNTFVASLVSEITTCLTTLGIPFSVVTETHSVPSPGLLDVEIRVNATNNTDMPLWLSFATDSNGTAAFSTDSDPLEVNYQFSSSLTGTLSSITVEVVATIEPGAQIPMGGYVGGIYGDGGLPFTYMVGSGTSQTYQYNIPLTGTDVFAGAYTLTVADLNNFETWIYADGTDGTGGIYNIDGVRVIVGIEEAISNDSVLTSICNTDDISDIQVTTVDADVCVTNNGFDVVQVKSVLDTVFDKGVRISQGIRHVDRTTGLPYTLIPGDTVQVCEQLMVPYGAIVTMLEFVTGLVSTNRIYSISIVGSGPTIPPYKVSFDNGATWSTFYNAHSWGDGETLSLDVSSMVIDVVNPGDQIEVIWER